MRFLTLISVFLTLLITSCSIQQVRDKRRIDKVVSRQGPEWVLGYVLDKYNVKDVVQKRETTFVEKGGEQIFKIDTLLLPGSKDTIVLEKEKLRVKYYRVKDTIRVSAECKSDTILVYKERQVYVNRNESILKYSILDEIKTAKQRFQKEATIVIVILVLILLAIFIRKILKAMSII